MCVKWKLIKVQGKWYNLLGMNGGRAYLGKLWDINNCCDDGFIIWEKQPFFYQHEYWYGGLLQSIVYRLRQIKNYFNEKNDFRITFYSIFALLNK